MTTLQNLTANTNAFQQINENFASVSPAGLFAVKPPTTSGLTLGYYGGILDGVSYSDGTHLLTASTTRYVVVERATGTVSSSTGTTNWNNGTDYMRMGIATVGASTFTWVDWREFTGGGGGGGGGSNDWGDLINIPAPIEDLAALTDPGADRILFWDDSAGEYTHLSVGSGLSISGTSLSASGGGGTGDVVGPASSVDNTLPRFDSTTGKLLQTSGLVVSDNDEISGFKGNINRQTGTTYTLQASDSGKIVELANGSSITLTLPNSLAAGFNCTLVQDGAGQVTLSAASGASIKNRQSHSKLAGEGAMASLYVSGNSGGSAAAYRFGGDTAA